MYHNVSFAGALKTIKAGTVTWSYRRFGPLTKQLPGKEFAPAIFISGLAFTMYIWPVPVLQRLAIDREVIIFDNMRVGNSVDSSKVPLTIDVMANQTAQFVKALKLGRKPDVFGWSIGGMIAATLGAKYSSQFSRFVIASGSAGGPTASPWPAPTASSLASIKPGDAPVFLSYLFPNGGNDPDACIMYASYLSWRPFSETWFSKQWLSEQTGAIDKFYKANTTYSMLGSVPNRVVVMHGVQDRIVPISNAPTLASVWRGAWLMQLAGDGHGLPFSAMQEFIFLGLEFFQFAQPLTSQQMAFYTYKG